MVIERKRWMLRLSVVRRKISVGVDWRPNGSGPDGTGRWHTLALIRPIPCVELVIFVR